MGGICCAFCSLSSLMSIVFHAFESKQLPDYKAKSFGVDRFAEPAAGPKERERGAVGRRKKSWLRNIREWTGVKSAAELFRVAKDRIRCAELTANLH
ncbi:hypothetical protein MSG28_010381 [Choristoneura fumiferana]|uniref:Uncharacterized protein n=1 Tax=Choristoneura fumiferana TaxID=7141 RepID=A0ACC0KKF5_CHOFU|nr:hypothetical protein MSG28_010381 [Choristoneura fumiferana]